MRRRKKQKKTHDDLVAHFQKRCMERWGFILSQRFLKEEMAAHRLRLHSKQSNTRTRFIYPVKDGRNMVVVYDKVRHAFVTALYLDEMKEDDGQ